jgi:hypothetical protein
MAFAPRPYARLNRPVLPEDEIERIRSEWQRSHLCQWDYLHLEGLRRELAATLAAMAGVRGPVLDLFCGTKPYLELIPGGPVWGLDLDRHFGRADDLGDLPLPFCDAAFGVVLCSQALYLVDDPVPTVEDGQGLEPGGRVIVTIPHLFVGEGDLERHWSKEHLCRLFEAWSDVRVRGIDGPGVALSYALGRVMMLAARRWGAPEACTRLWW